MLKIEKAHHRIELHSTGKAPNANAVLKVFDCSQDEQPQVAEIELGDFLSWAQYLFEGELRFNDGMDRHERKYKSQVKRVRKALGYTYP